MEGITEYNADFCDRFWLRFNIGKTKVVVIGKLNASTGSLACISLRGRFNIVVGSKLKMSVHGDLCWFFGSVNSVLTSTSRPRDNVQRLKILQVQRRSS